MLKEGKENSLKLRRSYLKVMKDEELRSSGHSSW